MEWLKRVYMLLTFHFLVFIVSLHAAVFEIDAIVVDGMLLRFDSFDA
jgi:hypothetical protein